MTGASGVRRAGSTIISAAVGLLFAAPALWLGPMGWLWAAPVLVAASFGVDASWTFTPFVRPSRWPCLGARA